MEVKTKQEDYQSTGTYFLIIGIIFVLCSAIMIAVFSAEETSGASIGSVLLSKLGILVIFSVFFLLVDVLLIINYFKPPKTVEAILRVKDEQMYHGRTVTYMMLDPVIPNQPSYAKVVHCPCYTETANEMKVGCSYQIMIKVHNNEILCVLNPNQYAGQSFQASPYDNSTNSMGTTNTSNLSSLTPAQQKELSALEALGVLSPNDVDVEFTQSDEKYIASAQLTVPSYVDIAGEKLFHLVSPYRDKRGEEVFFISDSFGQMVYCFKIDFSHPFTYVVSDYAKNPIAVLEHKPLQGYHKNRVRMVNGPAFSVKPSLGTTADFEVVGSEFEVLGREKGRVAPITIATKDGRLAAEITVSKEYISPKLYDIRVNSSVVATPELLLLAFCVCEPASTK